MRLALGRTLRVGGGARETKLRNPKERRAGAYVSKRNLENISKKNDENR